MGEKFVVAREVVFYFGRKDILMLSFLDDVKISIAECQIEILGLVLRKQDR